jgi:hypothetical protein
MTKIAGSRSRSISQRHGPSDPDPYQYQNVIDPQHNIAKFTRAWMRNEPSNVNQGPRARTPTPPPPPSATNINRSRPEERSDNLHDDEDGDDEDEEEEDDGEDSMADVYSLPPPLPLAASGGGRCPRLPPAEPPPLLEGLHMDLEQTDDTPPAILLSNHMVRSEIWIRYMGVKVRSHCTLERCMT